MKIGVFSQQFIYTRVQSHAAWVMPRWATHEWTMKAQCLFIAPLTLKQHTGGGIKQTPTMHYAPATHSTNVVWQPNTRGSHWDTDTVEAGSDIWGKSWHPTQCCCYCWWTQIERSRHIDASAFSGLHPAVSGVIVCLLWCSSCGDKPTFIQCVGYKRSKKVLRPMWNKNKRFHNV